MNWFAMELTSPFIIPLAFALLALLFAWSMYGAVAGRRFKKKSETGVPLAAAGESVVAQDKKAKYARVFRAASLLMVAMILSVLLAGPRDMQTGTTTTQENIFDASTALVVFDISGSVRNELFTSGQDFITYFLESQKENMQGNTRIGLSFYSAYSPNELFVYRAPSFDLDTLAYDVNNLSLERTLRPDLGESRFFRLSGATRTPEALEEAAAWLKEFEEAEGDVEGSSIILIVDIHSESGMNLANTKAAVADKIEEITEAGINVYVASITVERRKERVLGYLHGRLGANPRVAIYDILGATEEETAEIAAAVADMETKRFTRTIEVSASPEERGHGAGFALFALITTLLLLFLMEIFAGKTRGVQNKASENIGEELEDQRR